MSIKSKIWEKLDRDGYCTDKELFKIYGKMPNFGVAEAYKSQWNKFNSVKELFANKEIIEKAKHGRGYYIRIKGEDENIWHNVGFDYYLYLTSKDN